MNFLSIWSNNFDNNIAIWFSNLFDSFPSFLKEFFAIFSSLGNLGIFLLLLGIILLFIKPTRKLGIACFISVLFTLLFNDLIFKNIFSRARPFMDPDLMNDLPSIVHNNSVPYGIIPSSDSFPSGHTFQYFLMLTICFFLFIKNKDEKKIYLPFLIFFSVMAVLMGLSRLLLSHHYATDVIAGALLGISFGIGGYYLLVLFEKLKNKIIKQKNTN